MQVVCIMVVNIAELHCDFIEKQRAYCKIRGLFGKSEQEIKTALDLGYGENALQHLVQLPSGCQCLRKVDIILRMILALGCQFPLPLKKISSLSKPLLMKMKDYTVQEICDLYVFSSLKEVKVNKSVRSLDSAFCNF